MRSICSFINARHSLLRNELNRASSEVIDFDLVLCIMNQVGTRLYAVSTAVLRVGSCRGQGRCFYSNVRGGVSWRTINHTGIYSDRLAQIKIFTRTLLPKTVMYACSFSSDSPRSPCSACHQHLGGPIAGFKFSGP